MTSIIFLLLIVLLVLIYFLIEKNKEIKSLEEKVRDYTETEEIRIIRAKLEGRDKERIRIANDWHDGIGNSLSTLRLILDSIQAKNQERHTEALTLLEHALRDFRHIIDNELVDDFADEKRLLLTLEKWKKYLFLGNIEFNFNVYELKKYIFFPEDLKSHIYRISQEILANAINHAKPKRIVFLLSESENLLIIEIKDDGKGIEEDKTVLRSVQQRLVALSGKMIIGSEREFNTAIRIEIPLKSL